jgi:Tol biopolymer transport system component
MAVGRRGDILKMNWVSCYRVSHLLLGLFILSACIPATSISGLTEETQVSVTSVPGPTQISTPRPANTPTVSPVLQVSLTLPPIGLLYRDNTGLQVIDKQNQSELLLKITPGESASVSPDGESVIYISGDSRYQDYALINLATDQRTELDPGTGYSFCDIEWWQSNPNILVADVEPKELSGSMSCNSVPAIINIKEKSLELLGNKPGWNNFFDTSPDGQTIAFGQSGEPWLYSPAQGSKMLSMQKYSFPEIEDAFISHPSWSPSGRYLAWIIRGKLSGEDQQGIGVFDFQTKTSQFLYPYQVEGHDGGRSWIFWNPDEKSIILDNYSLDLMWNVSIDGTKSTSIKFIPRWNPDGNLFAYLEFDRHLEKASIVISNNISGDMNKVFLPLELGLVRWLTDSKVNWGDDNVLFWDSEGRNLLWSLDGKSLIVTIGNSSSRWNWIVDIESRQLYRLDLPEDAEIQGFLNIEE